MDEKDKKKKFSKAKIRAIIVAAVSVAVGLALIITNFFVPVKYLTSYMVTAKPAPEGIMRVRFVDVGYGDSIIIELPDGKNMLIDAGNGSGKTEGRILKYLNQSGIKKIDYLICTSVNSEHCGGLTEILKYKKVDRIYMPDCTNVYVTNEYRSFVLAARSSGVPVTISEYGVGAINKNYEYQFRFLSPSVRAAEGGEYDKLNSSSASTKTKNDASAVIWLEYAGTSFLFTSDVTNEVLTKICDAYEVEENYPVDIATCDIIQLACHGSENSACSRLFDTVSPSAAVISVGENGVASPSLDAIADAVCYVGDNLYRTDIHGTITIEVSKDGYKFL